MTTIAFKDGVLAADTLTHCDGRVYRHASKIGHGVDAGGFFLAAAVGEAGLCDRFLAWAMGAGARGAAAAPSMRAGEDSASGYVFRPTGWIEEHQPNGTVLRFKPHGGFFAAGSGADFALGAMKAGVSAAMAVKVAMEFDTRTGGDVDVASFQGEERPAIGRSRQVPHEPRDRTKRAKKATR